MAPLGTTFQGHCRAQNCYYLKNETASNISDEHLGKFEHNNHLLIDLHETHTRYSVALTPPPRFLTHFRVFFLSHILQRTRRRCCCCRIAPIPILFFFLSPDLFVSPFFANLNLEAVLLFFLFFFHSVRRLVYTTTTRRG